MIARFGVSPSFCCNWREADRPVPRSLRQVNGGPRRTDTDLRRCSGGSPSARGEALRDALNAACAKHGVAMQFTGIGSMMQPHFRTGLILRPYIATAEEDALRDGARAMVLISEVLSKTTSPSILQVDTLAAAQAAAGRFTDAVSTLDQLLVAVGASDASIRARLEARRAAYAEKRAWRGVTH